jgi:hypothetical protein
MLFVRFSAGLPPSPLSAALLLTLFLPGAYSLSAIFWVNVVTGREPGLPVPGMIPWSICDNGPTEELEMLNWFLRFFHRLGAWLLQRPSVTTDHQPVSEAYHPSNLHARRR